MGKVIKDNKGMMMKMSGMKPKGIIVGKKKAYKPK